MRACVECAGNARVHTVVLRALGVQACLSPLAEAGRMPQPRCSVHQLYKRDSVRRLPEKDRWSVEGGGETKKARLCTHVSEVDTVCRVCRVCTVVCVRRACVACARCATLCVAALRVAHCAWHSLG